MHIDTMASDISKQLNDYLSIKKKHRKCEKHLAMWTFAELETFFVQVSDRTMILSYI